MRKFKKEKKVVEVETTLDILCNKCGKSCIQGKHEHAQAEGLVEVEVSGGYDSTVIGDLMSWRFSVCEKCLEGFVKTFKIPVDVKDHGLHGYLPAPKAKEVSIKAYKDNMSEQLFYFVKQEGLNIPDLKNKVKKMKAEAIHKYLDKLREEVSNSKLIDARVKKETKEKALSR